MLTASRLNQRETASPARMHLLHQPSRHAYHIPTSRRSVESLGENKISQDTRSKSIKGSLQTEPTKGVLVRIDVDGPVWMYLKRSASHRRGREKKEGEGGPTHKPPFGDVWSLMWHWRLSHGRSRGYGRTADANAGTRKEVTRRKLS